MGKKTRDDKELVIADAVRRGAVSKDALSPHVECVHQILGAHVLDVGSGSANRLNNDTAVISVWFHHSVLIRANVACITLKIGVFPLAA